MRWIGSGGKMAAWMVWMDGSGWVGLGDVND